VGAPVGDTPTDAVALFDVIVPLLLLWA